MSLEIIHKLRRQLSDSEEWEDRQEAAKQLAALRGKAQIALKDLWESAWNDDDYDVRVSALEAIFLIDEDRQKIVREFIKLLADQEENVRESVAKHLGLLGTEAKEAISVLQNMMLNDSNADVRDSALQAYIFIQEDKTALIAEFENLLKNRAEQVRQQAVKGLRVLGEEAKDTVNSLWDIMQNDEDSDVRESAVYAIVAIEKDASKRFDQIKTLLLDGDDKHSDIALSMLEKMKLSDISIDKLIDLLGEFLQKPNNKEFIERVFTLSANKTSDNEENLTTLIFDDKIDSWKKSYSVLVPEIKNWLERKWETDTELVLSLILKAIKSEESQVREGAIELLEEKANDIPKSFHESSLKVLWECLRQYGEGFSVISKIDTTNDIISQMINDTLITPYVKGTILLKGSRDILEKRWENDKDNTTRFILEALKKSTWDIKNSAIDWLIQKTGEIPKNLYSEIIKEIKKAIEEIKRRGRLRLFAEEIDDNLEAALVLFERAQREIQISPLFKIIQEEENEDVRIDGIKKLMELESLVTLRALIQEWVQWIVYGKNPLLVEVTSEAMRYSIFAVLPLIDQLMKELSVDDSLKRHIGHEITPSEYRDLFEHVIIKNEPCEKNLKPNLQAWIKYIETKSKNIGELIITAKNQKWPEEELLRKAFNLFVNEDIKRRHLKVQQRIAKQLADMSDYRFFDEKKQDKYKNIKEELSKHAVPVLARRLPKEEDAEIRESLARVLGNVGEREAIEALAQAVVGEERTRSARQELLSKYYLEPSRERGEEAAKILRNAVDEARRTLRLIQNLNKIIFAVGMIILTSGLLSSMFYQDITKQVIGGLAGIGGLVGVITILIKDPLDRIQNAMANLVQLETAFTSFIWELNLNGTYIQSQYVAEGVLNDDEIARTVERIENAMNLAMNLVSVYTEEGRQRVVSRINSISPAASELGNIITIYGQHLQGDSSRKRHLRGIIAINHKPIEAESVSWNEHEIKFRLPLQLAENGETVWISLFIDGMETNALPFHIVNKHP